MPVQATPELPSFPQGWFAIAYSDDVVEGAALPKTFCGQDVVLFRTPSGTLSVLDAYCPHLGANLAYGGVVSDEGIRCPFHGWQWAANGKCTDMPYGGRIAPGTRTRAWHVAEQDDLIFVWNGEGEPTWQMPGLEGATWTAPRKMLRTVRSHPQDILENTVDLAHFRFVHKTHAMKLVGGPSSDGGPLFEVTMQSDPTGLDPAFRLPEGTLELGGAAYCHGPGLAGAQIGVEGMFRGLQRLYVTPIDGDVIELRGVVSVEIADGLQSDDALTDVIAKGVFEQWDLDIEIWTHKKHLLRPRTNPGELAIVAYRQWYRQFYAEPA